MQENQIMPSADGKVCTRCGEAITFERLGRLCAGCGQALHNTCVEPAGVSAGPESCAQCGNPLIRDDTLREAGDPATTCPCCQQATGSLKTYPLLSFAFLIFWMQATPLTITACPRCMRRQLFKWGGAQLLAANVVWPFVILPTLLFRLVATFRAGPVDYRPAPLRGLLIFLIWFCGIFASIGVWAVVIHPTAGALCYLLLSGGCFVVLVALAMIFKV
jgi:hypothetical protein